MLTKKNISVSLDLLAVSLLGLGNYEITSRLVALLIASA